MKANIFALTAFAVAAVAQDAITCVSVDPSVDHSKWVLAATGACTTAGALTTCNSISVESYFSAPGCNIAGPVRIKNGSATRKIVRLLGAGGASVAYYINAGDQCTTDLGLKHVTNYSFYIF